MLDRCVQQHLETWLAHCREGHDDAWSVPEHVEREFRRYLDRGILAPLGEPTAPPRIAPARGPPLWATAGSEYDPAADPLLQSVPAFEFDQRLSW